jgi:hypothetical protein
MSTRFREKMLIAKEYFIGIIISKELYMRFNCNLQNLSGCHYEQDGCCTHPARKENPGHCGSYVENKEQKGEGLCERSQ